jgi:hypothetical protein
MSFCEFIVANLTADLQYKAGSPRGSNESRPLTLMNIFLSKYGLPLSRTWFDEARFISVERLRNPSGCHRFGIKVDVASNTQSYC